ADLRVELDAVHRAGDVPDGGDRAGFRGGQRAEVAADGVDLVAVAHPHGRLGRVAAEERVVAVGDGEGGPAELPGGRRGDGAAQGVAGELHPVADAQHGDVQVEHLRVALRGVRLVHARRPAGEDDALRVQLLDAFGGDV